MTEERITQGIKMRWLQYSLVTRLCAAVTVVVLSTTILVATVALYFAQRTMQSAISAEQFLRISAIADAVDQKFVSRRILLRNFSASVSSHNLADAKTLQDFLVHHEKPLKEAFDNVAFLNTSGDLVANLNDAQTIGKVNVKDRDYFIETLVTKTGVISRPYRNRFSALEQVAITQPVLGKDGEVVYVISGSINLTEQNFLGELGEVRFGTTGYMFITNTDGIVVDHPQTSRILKHYETTEGPNLAIERAVAGFEGTTESTSRTGIDGLYAFKKIRQTDWVLGSLYPREEAFARIKLIERLTWAGAVLLTLLAGTLTFLLTRFELAPLARLHKHMQSSRSASRYAPMSRQPRADEIGDMAHTFESLMLERQVAQGKLQSNAKFLRDVTDNLPAVVAYFDREQRCLFSNKAGLQLRGKTQADIGTLTIDQALAPEVYAQLSPHFAGVFSGVPARFEGTYARGGTDNFFLCHLLPDVGQDGAIAGYYVMTFDITPQKIAERDRAASEVRIRLITDNLPALVSHIDASLHYTFANAHVRALHDNVDLVGLSMPVVRGSSDFALIEPFVKRALGGETVTFENKGYSARGISNNWYQSQFIPDRNLQGSVIGFYSMTLEVTARKNAELALLTSEQRLRNITDNLPVLISYVDRDERYRFANRTLKTWTGVDPQLVLGRTLREVIGEADYALREHAFRRVLCGETVQVEAETLCDGALRTVHTLYLPDMQDDGEVAGFYGLSTDVTAARQLEQQLGDLARVDVLTGLPNRLAFNECLSAALARRRRRDRDTLALLFVDVDHFKNINDTLGHAGGDEVLCELGRRLLGSVRSSDVVARLAGDEFVVILENLASPEVAASIAEKIVSRVQQSTFVFGERQLHVSASVGIAVVPAGDIQTGASELLALADSALYAAKGAGRNNFKIGVPQ